MNKLFHLFSLLALALFTGNPVQASPRNNPEMQEIAAGSDIKVYYSFDHYANNQKVQRTFISGDMLQAARGTKLLESSVWDVNDVVTKLTSLLSLHTHSRSTTTMVRKDLTNVSGMKNYERIMHTRNDNIELIVFGHHTRGDNYDEILVFRFRDTYCSRVIQFTGKLQIKDLTSILKLAK